ncbi:hypothetical protein DUNSADRAFT_1210 [Dunaliella salina]|uniref:Encoded protein n=1 Tax=Dunaliella salina TaxID=3046 RepID=A0ABQ7GXD8_DUNSA|nr:hypothetical protein DUNSADRAFT_1210 [Dunaliella salina]|eukprot:KAF5839266.1 hypothetical protein DUNSADRAFT_1210 [Dunaliella salina]
MRQRPCLLSTMHFRSLVIQIAFSKYMKTLHHRLFPYFAHKAWQASAHTEHSTVNRNRRGAEIKEEWPIQGTAPSAEGERRLTAQTESWLPVVLALCWRASMHLNKHPQAVGHILQ